MEEQEIVNRIRGACKIVGGNLKGLEGVLQHVKLTYDLSENKLKQLCKASKVCVANGEWYPDLRKRLRREEYRVSRKKIKKYNLVRRCMLTML